MKIKKFLIEFVVLFCITLVVNAVVIYMWNLITIAKVLSIGNYHSL